MLIAVVVGELVGVVVGGTVVVGEDVGVVVGGTVVVGEDVGVVVGDTVVVGEDVGVVVGFTVVVGELVGVVVVEVVGRGRHAVAANNPNTRDIASTMFTIFIKFFRGMIFSLL
jgi:hypothetical protein